MLRWLFGRRPPPVPSRLVVEKVSYLTDGGTTVIVGRDDQGRERNVTLTQRAFRGRNAGRLFFDGYKVPPRGDLERAVLRLLRDWLTETGRQPDAAPPSRRELAELARQRGSELVERDGALILNYPGGMIVGEDLIRNALLIPGQWLASHVDGVIRQVESADYGPPAR
jgi:hypothetical protein